MPHRISPAEVAFSVGHATAALLNASSDGRHPCPISPRGRVRVRGRGRGRRRRRRRHQDPHVQHYTRVVGHIWGGTHIWGRWRGQGRVAVLLQLLQLLLQLLPVIRSPLVPHRLRSSVSPSVRVRGACLRSSVSPSVRVRGACLRSSVSPSVRVRGACRGPSIVSIKASAEQR
jgi:hypothetical protein